MSPPKHRGPCKSCQPPTPATVTPSPWPGYEWVTRIQRCRGLVIDFNVILRSTKHQGRLVMRICPSHNSLHLHSFYPDKNTDTKQAFHALTSDRDVNDAYASALASRAGLAHDILRNHGWEDILWLIKNRRS